MVTDDEITRFKTDINLTEYAASCGYELDRRATSRGSASMRHPDGDKIIIGMDGQRWIYFSVHEHHSGTIIDLVQRRKSLNLGQVRKELRPWLGQQPGRVPITSYVPKLEPIPKDLLAVAARYEAAECVVGHHPYLCDTRALPASVLASERLAGRIRVDERGNALFGHRNTHGLCGFEIKNRGFTGFAGGGAKGLWGSNPHEHPHKADTRLVIAEDAIDAISYAVLKGLDHTRLVSTAGQMNPDQPALLRAAIAELPQGGTVVIARDNDEGGDAIATQITEIYALAGRIDLQLVDDPPTARGDDWNDVLRSSTAPTSRPEP